MAARATLILSGWSFGIAWVTALSSAAELPIDDVDTGTYVRRAILYNHFSLNLALPIMLTVSLRSTLSRPWISTFR